MARRVRKAGPGPRSKTSPKAPPEAPPKAPVPPAGESALVEYVEGDDASAFGRMLGGLIEANIASNPAKKVDFAGLKARVGIQVTDIDEAITLDFREGSLVVHDGLKPRRAITIRTDSETVLELSSLRIGPLGMPVYIDSTGRDVVYKLLTGRLRIDGMLTNLLTLNAVTRIFSVQ